MALIRATVERGLRASANWAPWDDRWYAPAVPPNPSGVQVTPETMLTHSAAWACSRIIAQSVGSLPCILYERLADGGRRRAVQHPLYDRLKEAPHDDLTSQAFFEAGTMNCLNRGASYAQILPGPRGFVDTLDPIHPDLIRPDPPQGRPTRYLMRQRDGTERPVPVEDIFRVPGLSLDGYTGLSVLTYARRTLGLAIALEEYGARYFGSGARPGVVLQTKGQLSPANAARLKADWEAMHGGLGNAHRTAVLEEGLEAKVLTFSPEDSQFLESRSFSIEDVARWYGVPLHMIGHTTKETSWGSGIEQMSLGFLTYTLLPWLVRWEQRIRLQLILGPQYYAEYLVDGMLRTDAKTRADSLQIQLRNGVLSPDEWRSLEGRNAVPEGRGDEFYMSVGMVPLGTETVEMLPTEQQVPGNAGGAHALVPYVRDAAARVLRKEGLALERAARRAGDDPVAWEAELASFYGEHGTYVADAMRLPPSEAGRYVVAQHESLRRFGPSLLGDAWEAAGVEQLSGLALGAGGRNGHAAAVG